MADHAADDDRAGHTGAGIAEFTPDAREVVTARPASVADRSLGGPSTPAQRAGFRRIGR
ncbi:hypothetical protein [Streptomyces sp. NPDC127066]|uniref:hypothetical protein n=1 Tax=Streptomyces sp. NPDC127066 TaxID=3347125 RepID=UPI003656967A